MATSISVNELPVPEIGKSLGNNLYAWRTGNKSYLQFGANLQLGEKFNSNAIFNVKGTDSSDTINSYGYRSKAKVNIEAGDGDDEYITHDDMTSTFYGGLGNDYANINPTSQKQYLMGEDGNDTLISSNGNDLLQGGDGQDKVIGGGGNDQLGGGTGADWLEGDSGNDHLMGEEGNDYLNGGADDDSLIGGYGNDKLFGGEGDDQLQGGYGNDLLLAGNGSNMYFGGAGADGFGLMRRHDQNVIGDFNHDEGDQLLIRKRHIDSVEVSFAGRGENGESQFWLESKMGLTGIQTKAGTTVEDIMGAIKM